MSIYIPFIPLRNRLCYHKLGFVRYWFRMGRMFEFKKMKLQTKLSLSFFVVTTVVAALFMTVLNLYFKQVMRRQIKEKLADLENQPVIPIDRP